jgi:flagellin-specific chaperone FliS
MEEEKIFKDLTKKYADLAKKIHSKDRRSMSLIKDCSKRIALLDKLRVLEVSYLKCLKNNVKRGHKGGAPGDSVVGDNKEDKESLEEYKDIGNQPVSNDDNDASATEAQLNVNHQRALAICTANVEKGFNTLDKGIYLTGITGNYIKENGKIIIEKSRNMTVSDVKTTLEDAIADLINKGMNRDEAKEFLNEASQIFTYKLQEFYNKNKDTTLDEAINTVYNKGNSFRESVMNKMSPVIVKAKEGLIHGIKSIWGKINTPPQQQTNAQSTSGSKGGSKKTTYRLNGEKVVLLHKNKKVQRSIYVKGNGKTKYCKIDHQYILLSKLKNKIQ